MYDEGQDFREHSGHVERMAGEMQGHGLDLRDKTVLDIGAGQGMHASFLLSLGCARLYETDVIDYGTLYGGGFVGLLAEKHERNHYPFDRDRVTFVTCSAMDLSFRSEEFDVVVSFNAFEHIPQPDRALREIFRCLRPGGCAYITFDPLYHADTGGHMFHRVPEPWGHLMYPRNEYVRMLREAGAPEEEVNDFLYGLNRWSLDDFRKLFRAAEKRGDIEIVHKEEWQGFQDPAHRKHPHWKQLRKWLSKKELKTRAMHLILRKKVKSAS